MPRIAIDCRFASGRGGLSTYVRGIVPALIASSGNAHQFFLLVSETSDAWLSPLQSNPAVEVVHVSCRHYSITEQLLIPRVLKKVKANLFFVPHFNAPLLTKVPTVIAVHDMILHQYPNTQSFLRKIAYRVLFSLSVYKASSILTVSEATKSQLLSSYPSLQRKITTVYPGISSNLQPFSDTEISATLSKYTVDRPYFLYIGNAKEHKNVQMLIDAFLAANLQGHTLVLLTGGREAKNLRLTRDVKRIEGVSEMELAHILSGATALVTATKMEGFCLPVIEAMACGIPVLASDTDPIPEVTKGHATLVPATIEAFTQGLKRMVTDSRVRIPERLLSAREFANSYTWSGAAARLRPILEHVIR